MDDINYWNKYYDIYDIILSKYEKKLLCKLDVIELCKKNLVDDDMIDKLVIELESKNIVNDEYFKRIMIVELMHNNKYSSNKSVKFFNERNIEVSDSEVVELKSFDLEKISYHVDKYFKTTNKSFSQSKYYICSKLMGYEFEMSDIEKVFNDFEFDDTKLLEKSYNKLIKVYPKEKVIKLLLNKGFKYENIKCLIGGLDD